ncbi:KpsF/GutQ family sugar-phosphate isomerase [bacterium]|nr:KpsF/GutQ family sugar-phosphate isomerase [candidate division CSSED10-310 bacterium]
MMDHDVLPLAGDVFRKEIEALEATEKVLGEGFRAAIETILQSNGKVVTMGIGKSGLVARKIAATLSSTGTQAVFVHPVECMHGDMGIILPQDIVLLLSTSGESDEIRKLMTFLRTRKIKVIALTARSESHLGQMADIVIPFVVPQEACPMGMAPMASTTVQMVIGDAMAAVLIKLHNFRPDDFAEFHPAGTLGKRLLLKVSDLMHSDDECPLVHSGTLMREAIVTMTGKAMGAVLIADGSGGLLGIITDGDLRRAVLRYDDLLTRTVDCLMTANPISIDLHVPAIDALHLMENRSSQIAVLPVIDSDRRIRGILRLHDLVLAGL